MSGSHKPAKTSRFSLLDIENENTPINMEKLSAETSKPQVPLLRSKTASKKRKSDVVDLDDPVVPFGDALAQCNQALESMVIGHNQSLETIEDLKKLATDRDRYIAKETV